MAGRCPPTPVKMAKVARYEILSAGRVEPWRKAKGVTLALEVVVLHWEDAKHGEMFHFDVSYKGRVEGRKDGMLANSSDGTLKETTYSAGTLHVALTKDR